MKQFITLLLIILVSCEDNQIQNNNPYLPNFGFEFTINMNLPQFNNLKFPSNAVFIDNPGVGIKGVIVFNGGSSNFLAYEAACPNQPITDCSLMKINGINAKCPCDEIEYSLFTGLGTNVKYPMRQYRIQIIDENTLRIFN